MPDPGSPNPDLAAYLLGTLEPGERARVEQELAADPAARAAADELAATAALLKQAAPAYELPAGLQDRTFEALDRAVAAEQRDAPRDAPRESMPSAQRPPRRSRRGRGRRRPLLGTSLLRGGALAGGLALALIAAVVIGSQLGGGEDRPGGSFELQAALSAPGGGAELASADVRETTQGRVVTLRSSELAVLPEGEYYALWFVGPEDSPADPDRISAGTFHPDAQGRTDVTFHAAVDPAKYPVVAVTEEPGDGDPAPTRPDVLRSSAAD